MKKLFLTICVIFAISSIAVAQWTTSGNNTYYNLNGNVGIGNTTFSAKFAVYQTTALGAVAKNNLLLSSIGGSTANNVQNNLWLVRNTAGSDFTTARLHDGISIDGSFVTPQANTLTWWERDPTADIQSWGNASNTYLTIKQGNLGIGTIAPTAKLDVTVSNSSFVNNIKFGDATSGYLAAGTNGIYLSNNSGNAVFTVLHTGNVGIGTTFPQNKLDVNGTVHSKSVLVDLNGWSDYVFKKDYRLRPLVDIKSYIDRNHHLPEIPSEKEMITNGLNVGEMNKLLIKKIEELTLYLIEKDEEKTQLAQLLSKQQDQINHLNKRLNQLLKRKKK